jgi:curli biogenesis system outer membrane secretion channel CsgG
MKTKVYFCLLILLIVSACATADVYKRPGVDFSNYSKIAVVGFSCLPNPTVGQEVADIVALEFLKKGYNVIERSQLSHILQEEKLKLVGLTEETKSVLRLSGICAIITGSVSRYDCRPVQSILPFMGTFIPWNTSDCHASLSLKMLDVKTGQVIWAANGSHSENEARMTASKILRKVINIISQQIPTK